MNKESLIKENVDFKAIGEEIPHELAAKMVKDHADKYAEESRAYVIGKTILEQLLAQPGCVGIRFFNALNESGENTLVYAGIDEKGRNILEITTVNEHGKIAITPAMIGDRSNGTISWY
jgi:hypothetical protein